MPQRDLRGHVLGVTLSMSSIDATTSINTTASGPFTFFMNLIRIFHYFYVIVKAWFGVLYGQYSTRPHLECYIVHTAQTNHALSVLL